MIVISSSFWMRVNRSMSCFRPRMQQYGRGVQASFAISNGVRRFHDSRRGFNFNEFFENGQALPPFSPEHRKIYGRAWSSDELRLKSFEDLQKLWFVLLKELNVLSTQSAEAARVGQRWFGMHRVHKVGI